jgi:hypothetical protein
MTWAKIVPRERRCNNVAKAQILSSLTHPVNTITQSTLPPFRVFATIFYGQKTQQYNVSKLL